MSGSREWDSMKTKGPAAFLHGLYMLITFPLRRPLMAGIVVCLGFLLFFYRFELLTLLEHYVGERPLKEAAQLQKDTVQKIDDKFSKLKKSIKEIVPDSVLNHEKEKTKPEEKERFIGWNVAKFQHAQYKPTERKTNKPVEAESFYKLRQKVLEQEKDNEVSTENSATESADRGGYFQIETAETKQNDLSEYYVVNATLPLDYSAKAEKLTGTVRVVNANSLIVGGKFLYLYGIYTNPAIYDVKEAQDYLIETVENKEAECYVVAYAQSSQTATALCFVQGRLLNKDMVNENLAANVALK